MIGVTNTDDTKTPVLADYIEQAVRLALGEDAPVQTSGPAFLQRKKSLQSTGSTAASPHTLQLECSDPNENDEEKVRYNVRVSQNKQQTSPYRIMQKSFSTAARELTSFTQEEEEEDNAYGEEIRFERESRRQYKRK